MTIKKLLKKLITAKFLVVLLMVTILPLFVYAVNKENFNIGSEAKHLRRPAPVPRRTPTRKPHNSHPFITNNDLGGGKVGHSYFGPIQAADRNLTDVLSFTVTGLPRGVQLDRQSCRKINTIYSDRVTYSCFFKGKPTYADIYYVRVFVTDNKGGTALKYLVLNIHP